MARVETEQVTMQFGLVGALAGAMITAGQQEGSEPRSLGTCRIQDLPGAARRAIDPGGASGMQAMIVVERSAASSVCIDGKFLVVVAGGQVHEVPVQGRREMIRIMEQLGWKFGKPESAEAAAHDARLIKMRAPKRRMSRAALVTLIIMGVIAVGCISALAIDHFLNKK